MVCWGTERSFVIQTTIIKQSKTFLKQFGSIGHTSGSQREQDLDSLTNYDGRVFPLHKKKQNKKKKQLTSGELAE